ncbi:hypothetical protein IFM89_015970 [Coptis chinensis]|uniref:Uncharacterized protein n=1 Tax=Coptis chinensis TaxID=261450 RepID=A0A835HQV9_9MAGN|nr:hypothetical protein IFM89_015970 [Coptis chinensis]
MGVGEKGLGVWKPHKAKLLASDPFATILKRVGVVKLFLGLMSDPKIDDLLFITIDHGPHGSHTLQPFSCGLGDRSCASGEVEFSNATRSENFVCRVSSPGCVTMGHLTPDYYDHGWVVLLICGDALFDLKGNLCKERRRHRVYTKHLILWLWSGPSEENKGM